MLVTITQKNIEDSIKRCGKCPLERALADLLDTGVVVAYNYWYIQGAATRFNLPNKARSFVVNFDSCPFIIINKDLPKPTAIEFEDITINDQKEIFLQGTKVHSLA